jgi:thiol-disulfide isomerase/thioredoxin
VVIVAAALGVASASCASARATTRGQRYVGERLELAAADLDGREVDVGALDGKVRLVDFWASWCTPCREAMPRLDEWAEELGPRGLEVFAVSIDEDRSQIIAFLERTPVRFRVLWDKGGDRLSARYVVKELPTTLVVDRKGIIRRVQEGEGTAEASATLRTVEQLLAESP